MFKIAIGLLVMVLFMGCNKKEENTNNQNTQEIVQKRASVPEDGIKFTLKTIDGKEFHLKEIPNGFKIKEAKDKAVFIIFFGYRCPPCLREIPRLIEFSKTHKDVEIIAIEVQGLPLDRLKNFVKSKGINYNVIAMEDEALGFISYIQVKAGWSGAIPFLITLNKKGKVVIIHTGGLLKEHLEQAYKETIKE